MQGEWRDLLGIYSGFLQETTNYDGEFQNFNPVGLISEPCNQNVVASAEKIPSFTRDLVAADEKNPSFNRNVGSFVQDYGNDSEVWKNNHLAELRSTSPNIYVGIESNFIETESASSIFAKQDCLLGSNQRNNGFGLSQLYTDGFPVPHDRNYNINSPPRSEADATSSTTNSFQFAPETPDQQKQLQNHRLSEILNFLVDDHSSQESDRHENLAISIRNEDIENRCDELLQNIVDSSSAAAVSILTEKKISDEGNEQQGIDLSETPEPKPTKRRKHRPKVIREEKPKTQKLTPPKINTPNQNPLVKRKYVRKNKLKLPETQQPSVVNEANSCKRALNFDLEYGTSDEKHQESIRDFDLNLDYQDTELCNGVNGKSEMPAVQIGQQSGCMKQAETACNASLSKNQMPSGCTLLPEMNFPTTPPAKGRYHTLNIIARNLSMRNVDPCQNIERNGISQLTNIDANALLDFDGKRWFKRGHCHGVEQTHPHTPNRSHSPILCQEMFRGTGNKSDSNNFNDKRRKTGNGPHRTICTEPAADKDCSRQDEMGGMNIVYAHKDTSLVNGGVLNSYFERENDSTLASKHNFQNQQVSSEVHPHIHLPASHSLQEIGTHSANKSAKKKTMEQTLSNQGRTDKVHHQWRKEVSGDYKIPSKKTRGKDKQKFPVSVDDITYQLKRLHINGQANKIVGQEQHALVPYEGGGAIIPYEAFDPIKKRKSRPKVDLDPETERIWKLLMGIEGSEGTEATDEKKKKWWENEREVFRGRAESFIARMHLVQGDRRFSQWKGSVVDSVIGVFLTQNVSDHLSSSAFMSLAAKFPLQSTNINQTGYPNGTTILVEEPDIQILEPGSGIKCHEKIGIDNLSSRSRTVANEHNRSHGSTTPINLLQMGNATISNGFYSHLTSSLIDVRSTNRDQQSENAEKLKASSSYTYPINLRDSIVSSGGFQLNMTTGSRSLGVGCFNGLGDEIVSPLRSDASGFVREKGVNQLSNRLGHIAESTSRTSARYNGMISFQSPRVDPYPYLNKHPTHQGNLRLGPQTENYQHFINNHQLDGTFSTEPIRPAEVQVQWQTNARQRTSNDLNFTGQSFTTERTNIKEQIDYPGKPRNGTETNISNAQKVKAEGEKRKTFDWDSLRKQAQSNGKRRERSQDTMDSLNYEAVRCADVKEISNSIKERGMNNMLAERIKDFLNRLVREHGSIDLEWLRDVPPDKAKDYLLSVRGLGLKSVECVRLLTLHHLAFPVDTNVGRIAVRLGWVPLQPLPESLQLHLLELYPVLETIQKYLWPRLCKLDQRTLYELHYQMITFGKVFCTKSKPNCNACPMRGECRHFASAFASARLALPGPEERSIVSSVAPIAADRNPAVVTKYMPLALAGNNPNQGGIIDRRYEPVVEEPATPEPETTEVLGSDIEDAFYEDTDEIPMIKLNTEEFILNLHNYMQDNMELQEADMSRALVALNPEAASIPTPKLKNVSRLRTEHQVYQLPDSHPLLNGLDKREDDDPSPYLLAIWTPGETASSVQPPETTCQTHGSAKLCSNKTCFTCNSTREANAQTVRGTLLIPCRTAMRGSFPLNGTYFQVNEMFADHESSLNPIDVPRAWIWNLPRRTVYFGTSVSTIFKGLSTEGIQYCFWRGFVCVRGFEQKTRSPRPLMARLHFPASKLVKTKNEEKSKVAQDSNRIPSYGTDHDLSVQRG